MGLRTEFSFTLPKGFVDDDGVLHRDGEMRLATARDEIEPLRDRSIQGPDDPYLTVLVLARVITRLGSLTDIGTADVERLFAADLAFLQDLYGIVNFGDPADVEALQATVLPDDEEVEVETAADVEAVVDDPGDAGDDVAGDVRTPRRRGRIEEVARPASA